MPGREGREEGIIIRHTTYTPVSLSLHLPASVLPPPDRSMGSLKSLPSKLFTGSPRAGPRWRRSDNEGQPALLCNHWVGGGAG